MSDTYMVLFTPERNRKALDLRQQGHSFQAIADQLGYPSQWAAKWAVMSGEHTGSESLWVNTVWNRYHREYTLDFTDAQDMKKRGSHLYPFTMEDVKDEDQGDHADLPVYRED